MIRSIFCFVLLSQYVSAQIPTDLEEHWDVSKKLAYNPNEIPKKCPAANSGTLPADATDASYHNFSCWRFSIENIIDKENMILRFGKNNVNYYWLTGYPTKGLSDNDKVSIIGLVKIVESKSYVTVLGAKKTLKTFTIVTQDQLDKDRLEQEEKELAKRMESIATLELKDGTKIEAVAISSKKGVVTLITKEKKRKEVAIGDFTAKSLVEVRNQLNPKKK